MDSRKRPGEMARDSTSPESYSKKLLLNKTRPVKSCTHCRQQKIKCDAVERYPNPCSRCSRMKRTCKIDPLFRPQKVSQVQSLRDDLVNLQKQLEELKERDNSGNNHSNISPTSTNSTVHSPANGSHAHGTNGTHGTHGIRSVDDSGDGLVQAGDEKPVPISPPVVTSHSTQENDTEVFILGQVSISLQKAEELHKRFMINYLPFLPIIQSNSANELYKQSVLLFWTVILTASLSEPEPSLYNSLCDSIKHLAIQTCWIQTPRSTHIVQALLILGMWPLPNEKILDDVSYRFIGLAKNLAMQLGLHRGKFIYEFSRSQKSLPDAEKWRTRTWLSIYFAEQVWSASLGLPPNISVDCLIESAKTDDSLPLSFRNLLILSMYYSKVVSLIGSDIKSADGLIEGRTRGPTLYILDQELDQIVTQLDLTDPSVEIYFLYVKLMISCFAFLPGTAKEDQSRFVVTAFHGGTRVVTLISKLVEKRRIIEYPIYVRQAVSYAALMLFRLHLSPMLIPQYVESARQSVVTVHRLFRNMLTAWKDFENDISRTAKILEKLNFVIITHPYLLTQAPGIITRMRSHLAASLFYELIWAIHEARRRGAPIKHNNNTEEEGSVPQQLIGPKPPAFAHLESVPPLPFYNQITRDDFTTNTTTTPNGTTITTLVPIHPNAASAVFGNNTTSSTTSSIAATAASASVSSVGNSANKTMAGNATNMTNTTTANFSSSGSNEQSNNVAPSTDSSAAAINIPQTSHNMPESLHLSLENATALLDSTGLSHDPLHLDTLMQGIDWMNGKGDDFLGWMDMSVSPF